MGKDLYSILGVSKSATKAEIKSAYHKLARKYHPDVNKDNPSAAEKFKEISAAYDILGDDEKRKKYDNNEIDGDGKPAGFGAGFGGALGRGGSGEKKSALSTSTSSGSLRLMPRWMCRGPSSLFWGWVCSFSSNIGVHSFGCVCHHVVGMMLSTARAGRQVAVWSSSLSQPKDSQMWSGQGESTKRAAPSWILMWTVR